MVIRKGALVAAFLAIAGATACGARTPTATNSTSLYTVTATVMQRPGQLPVACAFEDLPLPPIGCGGASLRNLDLLTMSGVERYSNGVRAINRYLRLIGTWDGSALVLSDTPQSARSGDATPMPLPSCSPSAEQGTAVSSELMTEIGHDLPQLASRGIQPLEFGPCGGSIWVLLVVADSASIQYMTGRYGPIQIAGWLQPFGTRAAGL